MMLNFTNLSKIDKHIKFLRKKIKSEDIFLVGGSIRDLLLDIENNPTDIDLTMRGTPEKIYKQTNKTGLSHFITEKFGTMTFITKPKTGEATNYELTPLRTEGDYEDFRHPEKIKWSNDLLLDSNRRDFTINSIYYTLQTFNQKSPKEKKTTDAKYCVSDKSILKLLDKHGFIFIANQNLYIIQNHKYISKLFKNGEFQPDFLPYLQNITKENIVSTLTRGEAKGGLKKSNKVRFLIDPHKGIHDLINKKIRTVGEADKRFGEDALRIIRGLRFVNVLNVKLKNYCNKNNETLNAVFDFDKPTWVSIKQNYKLVKKVAKERIKDEMMKVFQSDNPFGFVALLDEVNLIEFLFPALYLTKYIEQPVRYHPFDIYTHTLLSLFEIQKMNTDYLVKLAVLYHDVGKVGQFDSYKDDLSPEEIREILSGPLNHRKSGPGLTKNDLKKLGFSKKETDTIARYVEHHHKPEEMLYAKEENKEKKTRKFLSQAGYEKAQNIMDICIADRMGQYNPLQNSHDTGDVYALKGLLEKLHKEEGQFTIKDLAITGNDIIKTHKLKAGPQIGKLLNKALDRVMEDITGRNNKKTINTYIKQIL